MIAYFELTEDQFIKINNELFALEKFDLYSYKEIVKNYFNDYFHLVFLEVKDLSVNPVDLDFLNIIGENNRRFEIATTKVCSTAESLKGLPGLSNREYVPKKKRKIKLA